MSTLKLTPEQEDHIRKNIIAPWNELACSGPGPREKVEEAVQIAYARAGFGPPVDEEGNLTFIWASNPREGWEIATKLDVLDKWLCDKGFSNVIDRSSNDRRAKYDTAGWSTNKPPAVAHLNLRKDLLEAYRILGLPEPSEQEYAERRRAACYGRDDAFWVAFYEAMEYIEAKSLGRKENGECILDGFQAMARWGGWWWAFDCGAVLTDAPQYSTFNERSQLHGVRKAARRWAPSEKYPEGYALWFHNGFQTDERTIMRQFTPQDILNETNTEKARVMTEIYGEREMLEDLKLTPIDVSDHPATKGAELYRLERRNGQEPLTFVKVIDSTPDPVTGVSKRYILKVHPELRPLGTDGRGSLGSPQKLTAHNAVASTAGLRGEDYNPVQQT